MPTLRPVFQVFAVLLLFLGSAMLLPALVEWSYGHSDADDFFICATVPLFLGGSLLLASRGQAIELRARQAYILTAGAWLLLPAFAALPFMETDLRLSLADAYFEAVSAMTTTGSTILTDLESVRPGALIWRSFLQWLGGIGIIVMAIAILPFLRVGGMQLMRTESSDRSDKILPRPGQFAAYIGGVYFGLTALCLFAYASSGMSWFEAVNHAMTTLATGGFSTRDSSFVDFSPATQWLAVLFMLSGGLPFVLYVKFLRGQGGAFLRDVQVRDLATLLALAALLLALYAWRGGLPAADALRHSAFTVVSLVTTTGYASADYQTWGAVGAGMALLLMAIGGCTGSTAGGIKIFRWQILMQQARRTVLQTIQPNRVVPLTYEGRAVTGDVTASVSTFFFLYVFIVALTTLALTAVELDPLTALSGALTALGNVGPGLGTIIGPAGTFQPLPDFAKWVLSVAMILGRLELLTLLILLDPSFWRG